MAKIVIPQYFSDDEGKNHVISIITKMKGIIDDINIKKDFGFDFNIHFTEEKNINNKMKRIFNPLILRAQLKSGDSYFKNETEDSFDIYIDEDDIEIWRGSNTPVVLIVYKKSDKKAYWINIRKYIDDSDYKGYGSLKVCISKSNVLKKKTYLDFLDILYKEQKGIPYHQLIIYKPIYNFLLEKYNTIDSTDLLKYQETYEKTFTTIYAKENYNNDNVQLAIDFALSQRRLYSLHNSINNFEDLIRRIEQNKNIDAKYKSIIYYYLCVLYIEDNRFHDAEDSLKKVLVLNTKFKNKEVIKFNMLNALIFDGLGNIKEAVKNYNILISSKKIKNRILKGTICIFAGTLCRKHDLYTKSKKYFISSKELLNNHPYLLGISYSNLGSLHHIIGKYDVAKKFYNKALVMFEKTGNHPAKSAVYRNISSIESDESALTRKSYSDSYDYFRLSLQNKNKNEFEIVDAFKLEGHLNLSGEILKTYSENTKDLSWEYFDGINEFKKAETLCDHLGHQSGKTSIIYQKGKYLYLLGKKKNNYQLLFNALSHFIIINYEDGIKMIAKLGVNNKNIKEFLHILKWVNNIKGDRLAEIGRLIFYREYSDYIPDNQIRGVYRLLKKYESKGYNFINTFDFGRNANKAIGELSERLTKDQTVEIYNIIKKNISNGNRIVFDSNLDVLIKLNFKHFTHEQLKDIIETTKPLLSEPRTKESVYYVWLNLIYDVQSNYFTKMVYKNILTHCDGDVSKLGFVEIKTLSSPLFNKIRSKDLNKRIVNDFCNSLIETANRETIFSYGGGGSNISLILTQIFSKVELDLQDKIINTIIDYLNHRNLVSYKRIESIDAISYIKKHIPNDKINLLHDVLIHIIADTFPDLTKRYYEKESFFVKTPHDYKALKIKALMCLVQTGYKDYKYVFDNLNKILREDLLESTILTAVISLGIIGMELINTKYRHYIANYLLYFTNSPDYNVVAHSIFYLSKVIKIKDESSLQTFLYILNKMRDDPNDSVRWSVTKSCVNLKASNKKNTIINKIIKERKKDINYKIRSILIKP